VGWLEWCGWLLIGLLWYRLGYTWLF